MKVFQQSKSNYNCVQPMNGSIAKTEDATNRWADLFDFYITASHGGPPCRRIHWAELATTVADLITVSIAILHRAHCTLHTACSSDLPTSPWHHGMPSRRFVDGARSASQCSGAMQTRRPGQRESLPIPPAPSPPTIVVARQLTVGSQGRPRGHDPRPRSVRQKLLAPRSVRCRSPRRRRRAAVSMPITRRRREGRGGEGRGWS